MILVAQTIVIFFLFFFFRKILISHCTPTMVPYKDFDARKDADAIHKALDGHDANSGTLKEILSNRVCTQRKEIYRVYNELFNTDLKDRIGHHTGHTYEQLLKDLFDCGDDLMAIHLSRALHESGSRIRNKNIIEIMVTYTESAEKRANLTNTYQRIFGHSLDHDIKKELSGDFENVLLEMMARVRRAKQPTDEEQAKETAKKLHEEIGKWRNHRDLLDATLMETPFEQLDLVFQKFKEIDGEELEHVIKHKFVKRKRNIYQDLIHFCKSHVNNFTEYFSTRIHESVDGSGTDEQSLIRIILTHCETDWEEIKAQFEKSYNRSVFQKIARDTSGSFEGLLEAFVTGNAQAH